MRVLYCILYSAVTLVSFNYLNLNIFLGQLTMLLTLGTVKIFVDLSEENKNEEFKRNIPIRVSLSLFFIFWSSLLLILYFYFKRTELNINFVLCIFHMVNLLIIKLYADYIRIQSE